MKKSFTHTYKFSNKKKANSFAVHTKSKVQSKRKGYGVQVRFKY